MCSPKHKSKLGEEEEVVAWEKWPKNVVTSILPLRIKKMSFYHSELHKCHYGLKMLTQWRGRVDWHGVDVAMMWKSCGNFLLTLR